MMVKSKADLIEQLGCRAQVDHGGIDIDVSHVGGQGREFGVDLQPVPIPGPQAMNGKSMSEVMDSRLAVFMMSNSALFQ